MGLATRGFCVVIHGVAARARVIGAVHDEEAGMLEELEEAPDNDSPSAPGQETMPLPDPSRNRYPYCITWSPLPGITCCCPCVGHMGIADSEGIIRDFAGPYTIGKERMAFGSPTRYV